MGHGHRIAARFAMGVLVLMATPCFSADKIPGCAPAIGRVVSLQGMIEVRRAGSGPWHVVDRLDVPLCPRDILHVGARSRSALLLAPETLVRVDQNSTLLLRPEGAEIQVEMFKEDQVSPSQVGNACGAGYFITRFPKKFKVYTPYLNAAVEGTEFQVALACDRSELSVFEGRVAAESVAAQTSLLILTSGQVTSAGPGEEPAPIKALIHPTDAVQWALYYPPTSEASVDQIPTDCAGLAPEERVKCMTARAEGLLRAGRVAEAQTQIKALQESVPLSPDAMALSSVIALVKNEKEEALKLAQRAVELSDQSSRAWLALSYANQAHFKLEQALDATKKAAALAPNSSLIQARVAELLMSLGETKDAEKAAKQAVEANPKESRAHTVLGFVHLAQINTKQAKQDFTQAIELDSTDPLPRLGNGLAIIREGKLQEGREQLEIAVALDPTNSLIRSYVGKAYYEENTKERDTVAATQFERAKKLDPKDPTPHFYDAILKQTQNRPVEALEELQSSIEKNDNRAVYRSRLLLDEDRAGRNAHLAQAYSDIGLEELAARNAAESLAIDPTNYSAHRFLADANANIAQRQIASQSELLQAQLLQPLNLIPVRPSLSVTDFGNLGLAGSPLGDYGDYTQLFDRNRVHFSGSALAGDYRTFGSEGILSGLTERFSYSIGQSNFQTNGFRENNDLRYSVFDVFGQWMISPELSIQGEFRRRRTESGDLTLTLDPTVFFPKDRYGTDQDTARIGLRFAPSQSSAVLFSLVNTERRERLDGFFPDGSQISSSTKSQGYRAELQYLQRGSAWSLIVGGDLFRTRVDSRDAICDVSLVPCAPSDLFIDQPPAADSNQDSLYLYANVIPHDSVILTLGLSRTRTATELGFDDRTTNPKFGVQWRPITGLRIRAAAFEEVKPTLTIQERIEPTQVAGFDQFFDDPNGTVSRDRALGVDLDVNHKLYVGAEYHARRPKVPRFNPVTNGFDFEDRIRDQYSAYVAWIPLTNLSVVIKFQEEIDRRDPAFAEQDALPSRLDTTFILIEVRYFNPQGFFGSVLVTPASRNTREPLSSGLDSTTQHFVLLDAAIGYRLPQRRGTISLEGKNLLDERFSITDGVFSAAEQEAAGFIDGRFSSLRRQILLRFTANF